MNPEAMTTDDAARIAREMLVQLRELEKGLDVHSMGSSINHEWKRGRIAVCLRFAIDTVHALSIELNLLTTGEP